MQSVKPAAKPCGKLCPGAWCAAVRLAEVDKPDPLSLKAIRVEPTGTTPIAKGTVLRSHPASPAVCANPSKGCSTWSLSAPMAERPNPSDEEPKPWPACEGMLCATVMRSSLPANELERRVLRRLRSSSAGVSKSDKTCGQKVFCILDLFFLFASTQGIAATDRLARPKLGGIVHTSNAPSAKDIAIAACKGSSTTFRILTSTEEETVTAGWLNGLVPNARDAEAEVPNAAAADSIHSVLLPNQEALKL